MKFVLSGAYVYSNRRFRKADLLIQDGRILGMADSFPDGVPVFSFHGCYIFPGLVDVHVHLREPGFLYKETIATGTAAAARGGFTALCAMPNLSPVPDCREHLEAELSAIRKDAKVHVYPYGAVTKGQQGQALSAMGEMVNDVVAFSDDGRGIQSESLMRSAMEHCARYGKILAAHCEDTSLLHGGYIHDGAYAAKMGHKGICSESEWGPIKRDLRLAKETGCRYHVCHVSAKESVALIRKAQAEGVDVTCETAPHYLTLEDTQLREEGRFKMNPPIRGREDRLALLEGLSDGTISMIATDHAPHAGEEKDKGLAGSLMGVVGLETAFPVLYTHLVKPGILSLERLLELTHDNPAKRFGIGTELAVGQAADLTVFDPNRTYPIQSKEFLSKGKSTPFEGMEVTGAFRMTVCGGEIVWQEENKE
ncbi:MAG: dihydroorotase [Clostridia bacterium]|nr:dihydroorotase [Clostridia bacterium]